LRTAGFGSASAVAVLKRYSQRVEDFSEAISETTED
jgi:hypothetical protein